MILIGLTDGINGFEFPAVTIEYDSSEVSNNLTVSFDRKVDAIQDEIVAKRQIDVGAGKDRQRRDSTGVRVDYID